MQISVQFDSNQPAQEILKNLAALLGVSISIFSNGQPQPVTITNVTTPDVPKIGLAEAIATGFQATGLENTDPQTTGIVPTPAPASFVAPLLALTNPPAVELDSAGLPWDARIHGSTKTKNADGTWRKKKGVSEELVATVTAELRAVLGASTAPVAPTAAPVAQPIAPPPAPAPIVAAPIVPAAPPVPVAQVAPPPVVPVAPPVVDDNSYSGFVMWVSRIVGAAQFTEVEALAAIAAYGIVDAAGQGSMQLLAARPDLIPHIRDYIRKVAASTGRNAE